MTTNSEEVHESHSKEATKFMLQEKEIPLFRVNH